MNGISKIVHMKFIYAALSALNDRSTITGFRRDLNRRPYARRRGAASLPLRHCGAHNPIAYVYSVSMYMFESNFYIINLKFLRNRSFLQISSEFFRARFFEFSLFLYENLCPGQRVLQKVSFKHKWSSKSLRSLIPDKGVL